MPRAAAPWAEQGWLSRDGCSAPAWAEPCFHVEETPDLCAWPFLCRSEATPSPHAGFSRPRPGFLPCPVLSGTVWQIHRGGSHRPTAARHPGLSWDCPGPGDARAAAAPSPAAPGSPRTASAPAPGAHLLVPPGLGQQRSPVATLGGRGSGGGRCSPSRGCPASRGRHFRAHLPGRAVNNAQAALRRPQSPGGPRSSPGAPEPRAAARPLLAHRPLPPQAPAPLPPARPARPGSLLPWLRGGSALPRGGGGAGLLSGGSRARSPGLPPDRGAAGAALRPPSGGYQATAGSAPGRRLLAPGPALKAPLPPGSVSRVPRAVTGLPPARARSPGDLAVSPWGCDSVWGQVPVGLGTSEGLCGDKKGALWGWGCARVNEGTLAGPLWGHERVLVGMWQGPCGDMARSVKGHGGVPVRGRTCCVPMGALPEYVGT